MGKVWKYLVLIAVLLAAVYLMVGGMEGEDRPVLQEAEVEGMRIVSLSPNLTEILFELGLGQQIVGVSSDCDYPAGAAEKAKMGSFWQPSSERIVAARPDLVLTESFEQQRSLGETLSRMGYDIVTVDVAKMDDLWTAITKIGEVTDRTDEAAELVGRIQSRLAEVARRVADRQRVRILWVIQPEPLRVAGRDTFVNELLELAGGENAIGATVYQYPPIGTEQLLSAEPEVIIETSHGRMDKRINQVEQFWSKYASLPAVRNGRVYVLDSDTTLRLGPRIGEAAELVAEKLHGEISNE